MIKVILFDLARVILLPKAESFTGKLNDAYSRSQLEPNYSVWNEFTLNAELLEYTEHSLQDYTCCLFTTGVVHKDPAILPHLQPLFKKMYSVTEIALSKIDPESYQFIAKDLHVKPKEILFIDDTVGNILTAQKAGLQTIQFQSNAQLLSELQKLLF